MSKLSSQVEASPLPVTSLLSGRLSTEPSGFLTTFWPAMQHEQPVDRDVNSLLSNHSIAS